MSDTALLRIGILTAGLLLIAAILLFGRPKKKTQGRRVEGDPGADGAQRREPVLGGGVDAAGEEPLENRDAGLGGEAAREGAFGHVGVARKRADREGLVEVLERPGAGGRE